MSITLGLDIGSSSVKGCLYDTKTNKNLGSASSPDEEMSIEAPRVGWAEQDPNLWWEHVVRVCVRLRYEFPNLWNKVEAIGIAYQMHGLVCLDEDGFPVRPAIIWCDSRAVPYGTKAIQQFGKEALLSKLSNTPGNFTVSKMAWMISNEPEEWERVDKVMLPGDYIAYMLTGQISTSITGLSEMIAWNYRTHSIDQDLLDFYGIDPKRFPDHYPSLSNPVTILAKRADQLGLSPSTKITYRAGDQPNNAFGLGVNEPGELAVNAGTSGVVYAISDKPVFDHRESFNTFVHVNHQADDPRYGLLLCINGCAIHYAYTRKLIKAPDYETMNTWAASVRPGADGLRMLPFGNGAERMLGNTHPGAKTWALNVNQHNEKHFCRASLEGIAASLAYGIEQMRKAGVAIHTVNAGYANLFKSAVFREALVGMARVNLRMYQTDGSEAAAKGAAIGSGMADFTQIRPNILNEYSVDHNEVLEVSYAQVKTELWNEIQSLYHT
jgi:xylulokinase